jgi:SAM-dependent methyltransferase
MTVLPPTRQQVARQVDFLEASLGIERGATVLDVGCGLGTQALELSRRGMLVVGLDLSLPMITRAAEEAQQNGLKINFLHTDIREIEFEGTFDAVICLGTTFGFFDDDSNRDVLARLHNALRPGGRLLLDVVNRDYVLASQPNLVWFQGDECVCMEESDFNYFSSRLIVKRTMMQENGAQSEAEYSIRLYALHEIGKMMGQVGFRVLEVSGHEATRGVFFGVHSQRQIILAERRAGQSQTHERPALPVDG